MTDDMRSWADRYDALGWALVGIPGGSKGPTTFGWQTRATPPAFWNENPTWNMGLLHSLSGTVALDIDDMDQTRMIFGAMNIDLDAILRDNPRIVGRPERGKVLFRAPEGADLTTRKIAWPVDGDPRKTAVVFELRAGSVQDVLPPSIHPDTGKPYEWAGVPFDQIKPIPDQLLTIWKEWDRFRPQMMDVCPWIVRRETFRPPPKKRAEGQESVIDAYNAAVKIETALEGAGYTRYGNRWLSPNSTSKIPGVIIFDDGKAYSHHASDPFDPDHAFDAFEVFCIYEYLGNTTNAVKAAAEWLQIDSLPQADSEEERQRKREESQQGKRIWEGMRKTSLVPDHLLNVPGILSKAVDYYNRTARKKQPQFAVQAALALGSVVMGRRYKTDFQNMTSLYFLNVAPTGTGKEHANTVIGDVLEKAALGHLRGPSGYTSAPGVLSSLYMKPCHISVIDEFGNMLGSANASGNYHKRDSLSAIMEVFGRQMGVLRPSGYATIGMSENDKKKMEIFVSYPSLTLMGMTTPETFYENISSKDIASGFLNRFIIVQSREGRQKTRKPEDVEPDKMLLDWCKECANERIGDLGDGPEITPNPVVIPFSKASHALLDQYEDEIIARQDAMRSEAFAALINRSREIAMRVALIVARSKSEDEISAETTQWAIDYVDFYANDTLSVTEANMSEGATDKLKKKIVEAIKEAGSSGLNTTELRRAVPALGDKKKREKDDILDAIIEEYPVERLVQKQDGKGRPKIIHRMMVE
jgi:hypothetical protein